MGLSREKLVRRVERLLALSESNPNIQEAELAAERAQRLILKFNIEESELKGFEEGIVVSEFKFSGLRSSNYGKMLIVDSIARLNSCIVAFERHKGGMIDHTIKITGFKNDVEACSTIALKVLRSAEAVVEQYIDAGVHRPYGAVGFRSSFYYGVASRLTERFSSLLQGLGEGAIVVANKTKIVKEKMGDIDYVPTRTATSGSGFVLGQSFAEAAPFDESIR